MNVDFHKTVLLEEAVQALVTNRSGSYVDCTYGRGGHARHIAASLTPAGRLLVVDRDAAAISHATQAFADDPRVSIQQGAFSHISQHMKQHGIDSLDGALMDLGVSSPQLDTAQRGFAFSRPGPLDMRMDASQGLSAAEWLATADEAEIATVLSTYGEERFARRIARKIVAARALAPIDTTDRLAEIVEAAIPAPPLRRKRGERKKRDRHPATKTFQAIRIRVNDELTELETCLKDLVDLLNAGGRVVVISFHSLEDRIVKRFFRRLEKGDDLPAKLPIRDSQLNRRLKVLGKPMKPSAEEVEANARARSSIMRVAEKLA